MRGAKGETDPVCRWARAVSMEVRHVKRLKGIRSPLLALALVAVFTGTVLATGPSNFVGTLLFRGTLSESVHFNTGAVKFQTKGSTDVATVTVNVAAGGNSGWHEHPGIVLVSVKSGTITFYDKTCAGTSHPAGTTFVEANGDGPGIGRNETTLPVELVVTYLVPTGAALRIDTLVAPCVLP